MGSENGKKRQGQDPELAAIKQIRGILGRLEFHQGRRVVENIRDWFITRPIDGMGGTLKETMKDGGGQEATSTQPQRPLALR